MKRKSITSYFTPNKEARVISSVEQSSEPPKKSSKSLKEAAVQKTIEEFQRKFFPEFQKACFEIEGGKNKCCLCKQVRSDEPWNMRRHIVICKSRRGEEEIKQLCDNYGAKKHLIKPTKEQEDLFKALRIIVRENLPLTTFQKESWQESFGFNYCYRTVGKYLEVIEEAVKQDVTEELKGKKVGLMFDGWDSGNGIRALTVRPHDRFFPFFS